MEGKNRATLLCPRRNPQPGQTTNYVLRWTYAELVRAADGIFSDSGRAVEFTYGLIMDDTGVVVKTYGDVKSEDPARRLRGPRHAGSEQPALVNS